MLVQSRKFFVTLLAAAMAMHAHATFAAQEESVTAISAWQGEGRIFQTGENQALFVGAFDGILFVQDQKGALDASKIMCPAIVEIGLKDGRQQGEGRCIITGADGHRVFAKWSCEGIHLVGCKGTFTLTAGTGAYQGITGSSEFIIRSAIRELVVEAGSDSVEESAAGIAMWPALKYKIP